VATILVLSPDPRLRARFHTALGRRNRVLDLTGWAALPGTLLLRSAHVLAFEPEPDRDDAPRGELSWLRRRHPDLALLGCVDLRGRPLDAFRLGALGVDGIAVEGVDDDPGDLRRRVDTVLARALARRVRRTCEGRIDPLLLRCLGRATEHAAGVAGSDELAEAEGVDVRSLRRELRKRGLPPPGRILRWGRLLRAAAALDRDEGPVERIAHGLNYSTSAALSRALRREVGHPAATLRERGGLRCALEAFLSREGDPDGSAPAHP
jgi:AraC-like DNA-binding protein